MNIKALVGILAVSGLIFLTGIFLSAFHEEQALGATTLFPSGGGTGSTTLTGILKGNGTSPVGTVKIGNNLTWDGTTLSATGGAAWGAITGTLSNQADLDAKFSTKIGTSSALTAGAALLYATGINTVASVATTSCTISSPLTGSATCVGTGTFGIQAGGTSQNGYISSTDWNTFNFKQVNIGATTTNPLLATYFVATSTGSVTVPAFSMTEGEGIYRAGLNSLGLTNGVSGLTWDGTMFAPNTTAVRNLGGASNIWKQIFVNAASTTDITASNSIFMNAAGGFVYSGASKQLLTVASSSLNLPNAALANSTISGIALGGSLFTHTVSGTLTGTSYNGSAAVSDWAINLNNANTWTALQNSSAAGTTTFSGGHYASLLAAPYFNATSTTATSTFKGGIISNIFNCGAGFTLKTDTVGNIICGTDLSSAGGDPFTHPTVNLSSTSTILQLTGGLIVQASSTLGAPAATTTILGTLMVGNAAYNGTVLGTTTMLQVSTSTDMFAQAIFANVSGGNSASTELVMNNNLSNNSAYFASYGINGGNYNQPLFSAERPNDAFLYSSDGGMDFTIASSTQNNASSSFRWMTKGSQLSNIRMEIFNNGRIVMGTSTPMQAMFTLASSTGPQLALVDGVAGNNAWTFRTIANSFYLATSTALATSTTASFSINPNGIANFAQGVTVSGGTVGIGTSTPWGLLSLMSNVSTPFVIATSTNVTAIFAVENTGGIRTGAIQPATSSTMQVDWSTTPPLVELQIGTAAITVNIINATTSTYWGSRKVISVCNGTSTAGALTWGAGVEWIGGTVPTQTTTGNTCDFYSFIITRATSTILYKIAGSQGAGFK